MLNRQTIYFGTRVRVQDRRTFAANVRSKLAGGIRVGMVYVFDAIPLGVDADDVRPPLSWRLHQNYPNPFNGTTTIEYELPIAARVRIKVFDVLGKEVRTVVDEQREPGYHEAAFQGLDLPSGVYFYRLDAGSFTQTRRFLLLK